MELWRELIDSSRIIRNSIGPYVEDHTLSVEALHHKLESDPVLSVASHTRKLLEPYAKGLENTAFYRMCKELQAECRARLQERAIRDRTG